MVLMSVYYLMLMTGIINGYCNILRESTKLNYDFWLKIQILDGFVWFIDVAGYKKPYMYLIVRVQFNAVSE